MKRKTFSVGHGVTSVKLNLNALIEKRDTFFIVVDYIPLFFFFFGQLACQVLWFSCHFPFFLKK